MKTSENIDLIATALAKAQLQVKNPQKNTQGYGYKYADLPEVLSCIKEAMSCNGLSIFFSREYIDGKWLFISKMMHTSGQWLESSSPIIFSETGGKKSGMQELGSSLTYARRYALNEFLNICGEPDDDCGKDDRKLESTKHKESVLSDNDKSFLSQSSKMTSDFMLSMNLSETIEDLNDISTEIKKISSNLTLEDQKILREEFAKCRLKLKGRING